MLPRPSTQRATLTASLLVLTGCVVGGVNAIAPLESDDDDDEISVSESPALGSVPDDSDDGQGVVAPGDVGEGDAGGADSATPRQSCDSGLCSDLPDGCVSAQRDEHVYVFCEALLPWS